jgi:hypothetical protein
LIASARVHQDLRENPIAYAWQPKHSGAGFFIHNFYRERFMKISTYLAVFGLLGVIFGLSFFAVPELTGPLYGIPESPHTVMQARYFGATLFAVGVIYWLSRNVRDDAAICALLKGGLFGNAGGLAISAWAGMAGMQNQMAWSSVGIYGLLIAGALYFLASPARRA